MPSILQSHSGAQMEKKLQGVAFFDESGLIDELLLALVGIHGDIFVDFNDSPGLVALAQRSAL